MKVPTYSERLARTKTAGGGTFLTAQANPNAWGAMGKAMSDIGDTVFKIGEEKYKIQAASDVNETLPLFTAEIEAIKEKHKNNGNPIQAEKLVKKEMMNAYTRYTSGRMINAGTQQPYLSSRLAKSAFGTKASQLVSSGILNWKKANNSYILELNKINESKIIFDNDNIASDTSLEPDVRLNALNANHAVSLFNKNKPQDFSNYKGMPGKFAELAANGTFGTSKEFITRQKKSLENIVTGISLNIIKAKTHPSMSVTEVLVKGDVEQLKAVDPILAKVWELTSPEEKLDFIKKIRTLENNRKKDVEDAKKTKEAMDLAANNKIYNSIVNVDENNPTAVARAKENFKALKNDGYFEKPSDVNSVQDMLYPSEESKSRKTDPDVAEELLLLAQNNLLTKEKIDNVKLKLSDDDRKYWIRQLAVERTEAAAYVEKNLINSAFGIDKLSSSDVTFKKTLNQLRLAATSEFNAWRIKDGLAATFAEVEAKGTELMIPYTAKITALYKATFDLKINAFKSVEKYKTEFDALNKPYTLKNVLTFLTNKQAQNIAANRGAVDGRLLQWQKDFQKYDGVIGAELWNN